MSALKCSVSDMALCESKINDDYQSWKLAREENICRYKSSGMHLASTDIVLTHRCWNANLLQSETILSKLKRVSHFITSSVSINGKLSYCKCHRPQILHILLILAITNTYPHTMATISEVKPWQAALMSHWCSKTVWAWTSKRAVVEYPDFLSGNNRWLGILRLWARVASTSAPYQSFRNKKS